MKEHCWHGMGETFSNGYESSAKVQCCWCGAMAFQVTRRIGMDTVEGHGPHYVEPRFSVRVDLRHGENECPRSSLSGGAPHGQ